MLTATKKMLGELLCESAGLAPEALQQALDEQAGATPRPLLGMLLLARERIDERQLARALADQLGVPLWDLVAQPPDPAVKDLIPAAVAQAQQVIPQGFQNGYLQCVATGPIAPAERARIEFLANRPIRLAVAPASALAQQIQALYGVSVESMFARLAHENSDERSDAELVVHDLCEMAEEPTLINLVNVIISNAIAERASDIHIEPFENELRIKYRIDGVLQEMPPPPKQLQSAIISRVKIMAGMDIAERYVPQDGHIRVTLPAERVDIRVSTVPTIHGESVVLRLLSKNESLIQLTQLGMNTAIHDRFCRLVRRPYGIILVCGPTGSGKTTTLYSALREIYTPGKKIITIEDPVEYQFHGINQIPVRPKRGLTFASGLRSILRQDPDIIMVGEIRDRETADIAIRAALTGHLVFSTLHTNDAPGAITRLLDMGVEPFLIASSIQGVLAQRLVRRLCRFCRRAVAPETFLAEQFPGEDVPSRIWEPDGCDECRGRGYLGRIGIFELLTIHEELHGLILRAASSGEIKRAARARMLSMRQDGWQKIREGITTVAEVLQVSQLEAGDFAE